MSMVLSANREHFIRIVRATRPVDMPLRGFFITKFSVLGVPHPPHTDECEI